MANNPYQLDSALKNSGLWTRDGYPENMDLNNPCHAALVAHDIFFTQKKDSFENKNLWGFYGNPTCYGRSGEGISKDMKNNAPKYTKVEKTGLQVGYDKDKTCNWDGPFCHEDNNKGRIWNGGGNPSYQGSPWPCYGHAQFLKQTGDINNVGVSDKCSSAAGSTCNSNECEQLRIKSEKVADDICKKVYQ